MEVAPSPGWADSNTANNGTSSAEDSEMEKMSFTASPTNRGNSSQVAPSSERTALHRMYRFFKFITITTALLLLIAQVVSVVYLPFDGVELVIKIFLSTFSVLIILNELEWWGMLRDSPLFWRWIPRGYFYAFIGIVSLEENDLKPSSTTLTTLPIDYTAALFIESASWMVFGIGVTYGVFGLCCGDRYMSNARDNYSKRLEERRKIFENGLRADSAFSDQA